MIYENEDKNGIWISRCEIMEAMKNIGRNVNYIYKYIYIYIICLIK